MWLHEQRCVRWASCSPGLDIISDIDACHCAGAMLHFLTCLQSSMRIAGLSEDSHVDTQCKTAEQC